MTEAKSNEELAQDHAKVQKLIKSTFMAFFISIVIGIAGGFAVYHFLPEGKFPAFVLYLPGLLAVVFTCLPIRSRKKKWFPNDDDFKAAAAYKPEE